MKEKISAIHHSTPPPPPPPQVPASYINLQRLIAEEVRSCQEKGVPPVLSQKEFAALADRMPDSDISDPEELSLGEDLPPFLSSLSLLSTFLYS